MSDRWFFLNAQRERVGPVTRAALVHLFNLEHISNTTEVFAEHLGSWQQYDAVRELADATAGNPRSMAMAQDVGAPAEHVAATPAAAEPYVEVVEWELSMGMRLIREGGAVHGTITGMACPHLEIHACR